MVKIIGTIVADSLAARRNVMNLRSTAVSYFESSAIIYHFSSLVYFVLVFFLKSLDYHLRVLLL